MESGPDAVAYVLSRYWKLTGDDANDSGLTQVHGQLVAGPESPEELSLTIPSRQNSALADSRA